MSNPIRYDSTLVRGLARELDRRLRGRLARPALLLSPDLSATLLLDRGEALRFDLHASRGWTRIVSARADVAGGEAAAIRISSVGAPPDERILHIDLVGLGAFGGVRRRVVVELLTNQWNAFLVDADGGRILAALRGREAGGRSLGVGAEYRPPPPSDRTGDAADPAVDARWSTLLGMLPPSERARALVRHFAGTSPLNAGAILGAAATEEGDGLLTEAFLRWRGLQREEGTRPVLLRLPGGEQPYPLPLWGGESRPMPSLLEGMARVAAAPDTALPGQEDQREPILQSILARVAATERKLRALRREMESSGDAARLRGTGDLLLANLHLLHAGESRVTLTGFDGVEVEVDLDPSLRPHENAAAFYERARKRGRAEERLPDLLRRAEAERARWEEARGAVERGAELSGWAERALARPLGSAPAAPGAPRLPYRSFLTSGGLEVRVGRSARDNDLLTFRHAAPEDIWLHARSVPGSHVILRWGTPEAAPPSRDLHEAATLAALHSDARSSGVVAVDWTRRKHLRKPRGAAPGSVIPQRVKTVFVEPDPRVEERMLREEPIPVR